MVDSIGHCDFKQDQEAHRCDKVSEVDFTDFLMVVVMGHGDFKTRPRGP